MTTVLNCPCGSSPDITTEEPCNDYPNNMTYSWAAYCVCPKCNFSIDIPKQYKTPQDAESAAINLWNEHPAVAMHHLVLRSIKQQVADAAKAGYDQCISDFNITKTLDGWAPWQLSEQYHNVVIFNDIPKYRAYINSLKAKVK